MRRSTLIIMVMLIATAGVAYAEMGSNAGAFDGTLATTISADGSFTAPVKCEDRKTGETITVDVRIPGPQGPRGYRGRPGRGLSTAQVEAIVSARLRELGLGERFQLCKGYARALVDEEARIRAEADAKEKADREDEDRKLNSRIDDWGAERVAIGAVVIVVVGLCLLCFMKGIGGNK